MEVGIKGIDERVNGLMRLWRCGRGGGGGNGWWN